MKKKKKFTRVNGGRGRLLWYKEKNGVVCGVGYPEPGVIRVTGGKRKRTREKKNRGGVLSRRITNGGRVDWIESKPGVQGGTEISKKGGDRSRSRRKDTKWDAGSWPVVELAKTVNLNSKAGRTPLQGGLVMFNKKKPVSQCSQM